MSAAIAAALVREIEVAGGRIELRGRRVRVDPPRLGTPELVSRLRAVARELVSLLKARDGDTKPSPACELRRFPDWRPDCVIRFCFEPDHVHLDLVPTFKTDELDILLDWADTESLPQLSFPLRNTLLSLKARFGGGIVSEVPAQI